MLPRLNDATFSAMIESATPILVCFSAPKRCPRCSEQKPALEALAASGIPVYVLDIEQPDSQETERKLGGRGVPFSKVYAYGQLLNEKKGLTSAVDLRDVYMQGKRLAARAARGRGVGTVGGMLAGFGKDFE